MEKSNKAALKTCIGNFKDDINKVEKDCEILSFLIVQERQYIKKCQDNGIDETAIENEMDALFQLNEAEEKASFALNYLEETLSRLKDVKNNF